MTVVASFQAPLPSTRVTSSPWPPFHCVSAPLVAAPHPWPPLDQFVTRGIRSGSDHAKEQNHEEHAHRFTRLKTLASRPQGLRHEALRAMPRHSRNAMIQGPHAMVDRIADELDWRALDLHGSTYHPLRALALSILAGKAYNVFAEKPSERSNLYTSLDGLVDAGYFVRRLGSGRYCPRVIFASRGRDVIIAFAGTRTSHDFLRNLDAFQEEGFGGHVHAGMKKSMGEIWPELEAHLEEARARGGDHEPLRVALTGHSLGGAFALLTATRLHALEGYEVTSVLALGPPKAVDSEARDAIEASGLSERVWRVLLHSDLVYDLPWSIFGQYEHVGIPVYLDQDGWCHHAPSEAHVESERHGMFSWFDLFARGRHIKPLRDHEPASYVQALFLHHRDAPPRRASP